MIITQVIEKIVEFREALYESFKYRADALMDLLDALSSNSGARSVVELSLNPLFRRNYSSVEKAIDEFSAVSKNESVANETEIKEEEEKVRLAIIGEHIPALDERKFHLLATDVTPQPRPFAITLTDRKVVHAPNATLSNKPIAIGHEYSHLVYLPEKQSQQAPPWVIPLSVRRVSSTQNGISVGAAQLNTVIDEPALPFASQLCLHVGDGSYSTVRHISQGKKHENLVLAARLRSNRSLYCQPQQVTLNAKGHPIWYGKLFKVKNANHNSAHEKIETTYTSRNGHTFKVRIKAWHNLLMRGKKDCPMHDCPLTLLCINAYKSNGKPLYRRPLLLIVAGQRRQQISIIDIWMAYGQRYDIEHYFRFGKQRLLASSFQTPNTQHEENWWQLTALAYFQLFLAAPLAQRLPRPWEPKKLPASSSLLSPSLVQRDFPRIIRHFGTPALAPKPRGISMGRSPGIFLIARKVAPIIFKSKKKVVSQSSLL